MNGTCGNLACKEEPRTEIIGGRVVMQAAPSSAHEDAADNIYTIFRNYLRGKLCRVFTSNRAVHLDDGEIYEPDVKVVCDRSKIRPDGIHGAPDLVVEVLSPSTGRYDKGLKMRVYERCGVREYWIADPISKAVEQYVLEDNRFSLHGFYQLYDEVNLNLLSEERRREMAKEFRCVLFPDLTISLARIFDEEQNW